MTKLPSWINFEISGRSLPLTFWHSYAQLKRAAAGANLAVGKLSARIARAIARAAREVEQGKFDRDLAIDIFQVGAGTSTNMRLNEIIARRASHLSGQKIKANDQVNLSQSTNDTFHAALLMALRAQLQGALLESLESYEQTLARQIKRYQGLIKSGRTHLQDAVPLTAGQELQGFSIVRQKNRLKGLIKETLYLPLGGTAVGSGLNAGPVYQRAVYSELNKITAQNFKRATNHFGAMQQLDTVLTVSAALRGLAVAFTKVANDLRLLSSGPAAINEISLPLVVRGSSIMPGKINPSVPEMLNMVCQQVIGHDQTVMQAALAGQLELNVFMPIVAANVLPAADILARGLNMFTKQALAGLRFNQQIVKKNLAMNTMIVTALAPLTGYERATAIAKKAKQKGDSVYDIARAELDIPAAKLRKLLDPKNLI